MTPHDLAAIHAAHDHLLTLAARADVTPAQHAAAVDLLCETTDALDGVGS